MINPTPNNLEEFHMTLSKEHTEVLNQITQININYNKLNDKISDAWWEGILSGIGFTTVC